MVIRILLLLFVVSFSSIAQDSLILLNGKVKVGKIDVDNNNQVAMKYGIRSIPTLLLFKGGEVVDQVIGNVGKESIESMLNKAL